MTTPSAPRYLNSFYDKAGWLISIAFSPSPSDGGAPITDYRLTVTGPGLPDGATTYTERIDPATVYPTAGEFGEYWKVVGARLTFGAHYDLTVDASNDGGVTWGPAATSTADAPATPDVEITSAKATGHKTVSVTVNWRLSLDEPSQLTGFVVYLLEKPGDGSVRFRAASRTVGADIRSVTFDRVGDHPWDSDSGSVDETLPLPNDARFSVAVIPLAGELRTGDGDGRDIATPSSTPAAPAQPTGASGGASTTVADGRIVAKVPAAKAGDWVFGYAFSSPVALGWTQVAADGTATWSLAGAKLAAGTHHLSVLSDDGAVIGTAAFRLASGTGVTELASTGSDAALPLGAAAVLLFAGLALIVVRRARGARSAANGG
ncbi:hypothetical protein FJ657_14615 [Schumannella soli]|uniref:LPXTG cell wall anchor domain-containing protein n=1 Tax=Schumannella soli TaxID=2590779 RepID=A0A506XYK3_9MICO|nr:hypothetical protein FJ657_14615 [Schumannella soli]